jgi:ornithine carbamoyltransferase
VLALAARLKAAPYDLAPLRGPRTVACIYDKHTLRTQVSFAAAVAELGGYPMHVDGHLAEIGVRESVHDVARVLGRQASMIVWRTYAQSDLEEMAEHAGVPVVNALTDDFHPCQLLADLLTLQERHGRLAGLTVAFVGDAACNMGSSWLLAGATAGMHLQVGAPEAYLPAERMVDRARGIAQRTGASVRLTTDPGEAVAGADVVVTDTWVSMGRESEHEARLEAFRPYGVTRGLLDLAAPDAALLHCLPAYRGLEVEGEVIDGPRSLVWEEAENRRHAQKAVIAWLMAHHDRPEAVAT